jgi:ABC-type polysaccharide/polyol phosphate transport system ATPase subunit
MKPGYIRIENLTKSYRLSVAQRETVKDILVGKRKNKPVKKAVNNITLEIEPGECLGLIGHNGAGKSTLLKCIAGILCPDQGEVETHGRVSALLELGAGFHADFTGRENIHLNATLLGMRRTEIKTIEDDIIEFSGIRESIDDPVRTYSSGMYARLAFAVATLVEPDILLLDELLAVGDAAFVERAYNRMHALVKGGRTVVIASHGMGSVLELCDRAAWIDHGTLRSLGKPQEVVDQYLLHSQGGA